MTDGITTLNDKKKILFISNPMQCGGIEKALLSILSVMDYNKYDVFFMPYITGSFEWDGMVPEEVHRLNPPDYLRWHMMYRGDVFPFIKAHITSSLMIASYIRALMKGWKAGYMDVGRQWFWKWTKDRYPAYKELLADEKKASRSVTEFDIAVDFRGEIGCYFMLDKIWAKKKIAWYHGDYRNYSRDREVDGEYWERLDGMVTIADELAEVLKGTFPFLKNKVTVVHNLMLWDQMQRLAGDGIKRHKKGSIYIISVGRLTEEKGYDNAIRTCKELKSRGVNVEWHLIGDGPSKKELRTLAKREDVKDCFFFEGKVDNPYPYYRNADIYVHTSIMEGRPITIEEAKMFCIPIVSTHFPTVVNQLEDRINGSIADFEPIHIADAIQELAADKSLADQYRESLRKNRTDSSIYIERLNSLWETI